MVCGCGDLSGSAEGPVSSFCGQDSEPSCCIEGDCHFLKEHFAALTGSRDFSVQVASWT